MDENVAPLAASAPMSLVDQSQISTCRPRSVMRLTRSANGRSRYSISALAASVKLALHSVTAAPVSTLSTAANATANAVRAAAPGTGDGPPVRTASTNAVSSPAYAACSRSVSRRAVSTWMPPAS